MKKNNYLYLILVTFGIGASPAEYLYQSARGFLEKHDKENALSLLTKAHEIDPNYDEVTIQLASIHFFSREYQQAIPYFEHYLRRKPCDSDMRFYLGSAYNYLGDFNQATKQFQGSYNLSHDEIARVELLKNYIRDQQWQLALQYITPKLWWHNSNIYDKRVLLDMAKDGNGIGDIIFFLRYAKILKQAGAHVTAIIPPLLQPLCKCCPYLDEILSAQDQNKNYDHSYSICIASLILCSKNKLYATFRDIPYLIVPQSLCDEWQNRLASDHNFKIGLYWEGTINKSHFLGKPLQNPRSVPFDCLQILKSIKGVSWYSLQKKPTTWPSDFPLISLGADFDEKNGAFMDSAAIIKQLDLIISIDGSLAHLAGALGAPIWIMLPCENDYRWFSNRADSPWYPSMRLFRQKECGNWASVVTEIKNTLANLLMLEQ